MRTPTTKQYDMLLALGGGSALVVGSKGRVGPLLRHGWVAGTLVEEKRPYYKWVRITPEGLRALALAVERYGLPDLGPKPSSYKRVCARCGSDNYRFERVEHENPDDVATGADDFGMRAGEC